VNRVRLSPRRDSGPAAQGAPIRIGSADVARRGRSETVAAIHAARVLGALMSERPLVEVNVLEHVDLPDGTVRLRLFDGDALRVRVHGHEPVAAQGPLQRLLFFGSILFNSIPTNYINDKVLIEVEHLEDLDIINENKPYLEKKTKEVFGKKIELDFGSKLTDKHKRNQVTAKTNSASLEKADDNSLVNTVITQLGGKEIRRYTE